MADRHDSRPWRAGLLALALLTAVVVLVEGHGTTFFYDEWGYLLLRRGTSAHTLLDPLNGNLSLVPIVLFKALVQVFGADGYPAWRVTLIVLHLTVVGLVWALLRSRVGEFGAALGAALVLVLGRSADNLIWPAQFGYVLSTIGGLIAFVGVDRGRGRGDLLVVGGLVLGLASSSTALPLYAGVVLMLLLVRSERGRIWTAVLPAVLYALWSLGYGDSQFEWANVPKTPDFAATMAATAAGGAFGLPVELGRPIVILLLVALAVWFVRGGRATPRLWAALGGLVITWVLAGFARASIEDPSAPRFIYVAVVLGVLAAGEIAATRDRARVDATVSAPVVPGVALAGLLFSTLAGWGALHARALDLRGYAETARARATATELTSDIVPADYVVVPEQVAVIAGPLLSAERDFGRVSYTRRELADAPLEARDAADDTLRLIGAVQLRAGGTRVGSQPPAVVGLGGVTQEPVAGAPCARLVPGAGGGQPELAGLPGQAFSIDVDRPTPAYAWRFGAKPDAVTAQLPRGRSTLVLRRDAPGGDPVRPWVVELGAAGAVTACIGR